jgi:hypothetical protein
MNVRLYFQMLTLHRCLVTSVAIIHRELLRMLLLLALYNALTAAKYVRPVFNANTDALTILIELSKPSCAALYGKLAASDKLYMENVSLGL